MNVPQWPIATGREAELLRQVLADGRWGGFHPFVAQFEREFAAFQHCAHGITAFNGTVTLEMALEALGIGAGDEVIVPAISFISTATAVSRRGAVPVFADIEPYTFHIDPARAAAAITSRTRAIMAVHFGGAVADMDRLLSLGVPVLEDAAHAHGSEWRGKRAGSIGAAGSFSFQNSKVMTAGEGGIEQRGRKTGTFRAKIAKFRGRPRCGLLRAMSEHGEDPFDWVGATLDGKYQVDAVVGRGGFGVVYRAHHLGFNEKVAVKCLRIPQTLSGAARDEFEQNFLAEGRLLHQLSRATAGIVQALDVGAVVSPNKTWTPFIVLEWLDGQSLEANFAERRSTGVGGRSLRAAVELLDSAARALALAHEQGIAHRDIKPANLFLAEVGGRKTLKVLDFGIAKVVSESESFSKAFEETGASLQAFTARYGSPEQFSRRYGATGPWSDVFSLALVLIEAANAASARSASP